jgi:hypothetical protein
MFCLNLVFCAVAAKRPMLQACHTPTREGAPSRPETTDPNMNLYHWLAFASTRRGNEGNGIFWKNTGKALSCARILRGDQVVDVT